MRLAEVFTRIYGNDPPVGFRAYDGSSVATGAGADTGRSATRRLELRGQRAQTGARPARAYVTGALDVVGDLYQAMRALWYLDVDLPKRECGGSSTSWAV